MSGFEVAGLVLGVLPIAVQALRGYMGLLSSIKQSERTLKALIRDLETEHLRLQTTCEVLLDGVAPPTAIDELIRTPLSPKWEPYNDQIRLRLWTTWDKFYEHILDMQKAAEELREKLCLERDGSVCCLPIQTSTKPSHSLPLPPHLKRAEIPLEAPCTRLICPQRPN